jgi:hypothetical protein
MAVMVFGRHHSTLITEIEDEKILGDKGDHFKLINPEISIRNSPGDHKHVQNEGVPVIRQKSIESIQSSTTIPSSMSCAQQIRNLPLLVDPKKLHESLAPK